MRLKSKINYWKEVRGRTTKWIAREMGVSPEIVSRWANNKSYPSVHTIFHLAELFDCKVDDLYERKDDD